MTDGIDDDTAEDIQAEAEDVGDDVSWWQQLGATAYLVALYASIGVALAAGVWLGYITPDITVTATVSAGWVLEYIIGGLAGGFLLFTFGMLLAALPGSIIGLFGSIAYGIAESQGLINDTETNE